MASLKLKLMVDKRMNRVLFAEAGKDFVDFIFHILCLPVGSITRILSCADNSETALPGCLRSLYEGLEVLDGYFIYPNVKEHLLKSKVPFYCESTLRLLPEASLPSIRGFRQCSYGENPVRLFDNDWELPSSPCVSCKQSYCSRSLLRIEGDPLDLAAVKGGFKDGYVKLHGFMVLDNLVVKPMSAVSALSLMGSKDLVSNFESMEVDFSRDEAMKLLKASLQSKTVFTDIFLDGKAGNGVTKTPRRG